MSELNEGAQCYHKHDDQTERPRRNSCHDTEQKGDHRKNHLVIMRSQAGICNGWKADIRFGSHHRCVDAFLFVLEFQ